MGEAPGPGSNDLTADHEPDRPPGVVAAESVASTEPAVSPEPPAPSGPDPTGPNGLELGPTPEAAPAEVSAPDETAPLATPGPEAAPAPSVATTGSAAAAVPTPPVPEPGAPGPGATPPTAPAAEPSAPEPALSPSGPAASGSEPEPSEPSAAPVGTPQAPPAEVSAPDESASPVTAEPGATPAPSVEGAGSTAAAVSTPAAAPVTSESTPAPESTSPPRPEPAAPAETPGSGPAPAQTARESGKRRKRSPRRPPKPPTKIVEGVVTEVSPTEVVLQLDDGRTGVINGQNFGPGPETPDQLLSVGDRCFGAELARHDPRERVVLSRAWALKTRAWEGVVAAAADSTVVTGTITSAGGKGAVVDVGLPGFVPTSHLSLDPIDDLQAYVGQRLEFRVLEADPARDRLVLSRRALLMKEQRRRAQALLAGLKAGERRTGTVVSLADYGAFVELGDGLSGLVHLSELSWSRVRRPADVVSVGDEVEVEVIDVKAKKRRVSLSIRRLVPDPMAEIEVDHIYTGPVTRLVDFGAFVAVNGVEGLVHLSELAEHRVNSAAEIVAQGQEVWVKVLSVDRRRRRLELSIRRAAEYG